ncbi:efflux RND transporter permease subunit [Xinfangfangia pollutisoli]|uniref:efflux RND transporter permease subunit n=1 Tax=Xinfangfangia pollutisoli TaxID=2865960 RepID=UPI001CD23CF8|nr:efflux RND transporter permease subunit [Xinfangfangia pollutisoli]
MNFSAWAIRNPVAPLLGFFLLMLIGWQSFNTLPITRFPNIDVPIVSIAVAQPGAAPAEIETQITKEIEDAVAGVTGVKNVTSSISDGLSTTAVEFYMEIPTDKAVQDVKDAIDRIRGDLPGDIEAPIVARVDVEGGSILTYSVSSPDMTLEELSWFVDDTLKRALQGRPGIGRVDRYGGADREIRINLDPVKLGSYGITALEVSQQLALTNANVGSGKTEIGAGQQSIRTLGNQDTAAALAEASIALRSGRHVRLSDLGEVVDSYQEPESFGRRNGEPVVMMGVFRSKGASEVTVAETTAAVVDEIRARTPGISIELVDDAVYYTYGNYESALHTLIEGALLAVLVVFVFLRNWRATLIAAVALPLSAVPTFWVMEAVGFSLNLVSFLALTLATGILVDDAIVEIENIARHIRMGKSPYRAAIEAADEIGLAVIATTSTIVAVFVPVSFMPGIPGQYFRQFGITVAVAVIFSLLVARLITPMMAAYFMTPRDTGHDDHRDGLFMRFYLWLVRKSTAMPRLFGSRVRFPAYYMTLVVAVAVVIVSVQLMLQVPGNLFPPDDESRFAISVELPPGATLEETDRTTERMRQAIADIPGIETVLVVGGSSPLGDLDVRRADMRVLLEKRDVGLERRLLEVASGIPLLRDIITVPPSETRTQPQVEIEAEVFARLAAIPDIRAFKLGGPGAGGRPVSYNVLSADEGDLKQAVSQIERALAGEPLLSNVSTESTLPRPEVQITPRLDEAARLGVTTQAIAATLRVATIGDNDAALAKLSVDNRLIPVRVRLDDASRESLDRIAALKVPTASGALVPLAAVAGIEVSEGPATIKRLNRQRVATVGADLPVGVPLDSATQRFEAIVFGDPAQGIAPLALPASVTVKPSGDAEVQAELVSSFENAMIMGLMLVLTVLILLFKSVIQPFTILFSLPLAIGGVAAALIITQNPMSMPVMIGLLMLMGIVTKNAILLIDFAIEMRVRGMNRIAAVVEAGHKRARPIVMTSIAMSAGMLPSALGVGEGGTFRAPMAIAVIGGIIMSTVLSLVVVPAFYLIMDDLSRALSWVFGRFIGPKEAEAQAPSAEELVTRLRSGDERAALIGARLAALEDRIGRPAPPSAQAAE